MDDCGLSTPLQLTSSSKKRAHAWQLAVLLYVTVFLFDIILLNSIIIIIIVVIVIVLILALLLLLLYIDRATGLSLRHCRRSRYGRRGR
jgi:hypothetical protein